MNRFFLPALVALALSIPFWGNTPIVSAALETPTPICYPDRFYPGASCPPEEIIPLPGFEKPVWERPVSGVN